MLLNEKISTALVIDALLDGGVQIFVTFEYNLLNIYVSLAVVVAHFFSIFVVYLIVLQVEYTKIAIQDQFFALK